MLHPGQIRAMHRATEPVLKAAVPAASRLKATRRTFVIYAVLGAIACLEIWHLVSVGVQHSPAAALSVHPRKMYHDSDW